MVGPDQARAGGGSPSAVQSARKVCAGPGSTEMFTIRGGAVRGRRWWLVTAWEGEEAERSVVPEQRAKAGDVLWTQKPER
jgi:hypothetical protein